MTKVLKFGGTSVGSAVNMRSVVKVVTAEKSTVTVLSAMSGTTDSLVKISALAAQDGKGSEIIDIIGFLRGKYGTLISDVLTGARREEAMRLMEETFETIKREAEGFKEYTSERIILAQGEILTTKIFTLFMQESGYNARLLYAPDFMHSDEEKRINVEGLEREILPLVKEKDVYYITQGFICTNDRGGLDNLGRGGSDYSAAVIGAAIRADEVQVWTDIDGMHNNDPRYVEKTYPIRKMSFDEAAELAYFGAKILHPATIQPCKDRGIPVLLKNTMDPAAEGTRISDEDDFSSDFHAVAAKDGIIVIRIYSARMLMAYGFLRKVFEIFEEHRTPIDMITTSEVSVSITIDNDCHLDAIVKELSDLGTIEIERDNTIVSIVGNLDHRQVGMASAIMEGVKDVPLKMISYGASHRSISVLVDTKYKKEVLQSLNNTLFNGGNK